MVISTIPALTASVNVPHLIAMEHPLGRTMGAPGDSQRQLEVLKASLQVVVYMQTPGMIEHLSFVWSETPAKMRMDGSSPTLISLYLRKHPWLFPKLLKREIPTNP
ncbi:MAG: hypothetical protein ABIJ65_12360 [Chloroflexota bacterium]